MSRIGQIGFRTASGEPAIGYLYLAYFERIHRYIAYALLEGRHDCFTSDSAIDALAAARKWLLDSGLEYVRELPQQGPKHLRIVRFSGRTFATDEVVGIPLEDEDVHELVHCRNPSQLRGFLGRTLRTRLSQKERALLDDWLADPACSWAVLPADAQKAASHEGDFDVDERFLSYINQSS